MKEHAKKALKHDFEVAGKTVPTLAIAVLFLVGTGSAALLSSFGTVSGDAEVTQAITLDAETGQTAAEFDFNGTQTAGETFVETHTLYNNANVSTTVDFETTCEKGGSSDTDSTSQVIDWSGECDGIDTQYVEYFDDAGADFSSYSSPDSGVVVGPGNISSHLSNGQSETLIAVAGDYSSFTVSDSDTVVARNSPNSQDSADVTGGKIGIEIAAGADSATVKGFNVSPAKQSGEDTRGILVKASDVTVDSNIVHDLESQEHAIGVFIYGKNEDVSGTQVVNNKIYDVYAVDLSQDSRSVGVTVTDESGEADNVNVEQNTIMEIGDQDSSMSNGVEVNGGDAVDFNITHNYFSEIDFKPGAYTPITGGVYITGYGEDSSGVSNPYGAEEVSYNVFNLSEDSKTVGVKLWDAYHDGHLNAGNNWWDTDGIKYAVHDVVNPTDSKKNGVDASWKTKSDLTLEDQSSDEFGIVNEFSIRLKPDTYTLESSVLADSQTS